MSHPGSPGSRGRLGGLAGDRMGGFGRRALPRTAYFEASKQPTREIRTRTCRLIGRLIVIGLGSQSLHYSVHYMYINNLTFSQHKITRLYSDILGSDLRRA